MGSKLKFKFRDKESGWIPISIQTPDTSIEIDASDIPADPIEELIKAVESSCTCKQKSEAWLHLEPNFYKLSFKPKDNIIELTVSFVEVSESITSPGNAEKNEIRELVYSCTQQDMLTAFWRGLKDYSSRVSWYGDEVTRLESKVNEYKS